MNSIFMIVSFAIVLIPMFISLMFMPYWTRKTESFGVSIPESIYNLPALKEMRRLYARIIGIVSVGSLAAFILLSLFVSQNVQTTSIMFGTVTVLFMFLSFVIYLRFHKSMKALKADKQWQKEKPQRVVVDTSFRQERLTFSNGWFIIPFAISIGSMLITFQMYDRIPEQIPMQYNFSGEVTNWAEKSYQTVILMPVMQVYLTLLFLFINSMIAKAKQQVSVENPEKSKYRNVLFRRRWSLFIVLTSIATVLLFSLIQLSYLYPVSEKLLIYSSLLFAGAVVVSAVVLSVTTGQGGSRVNITETSQGEVIDQDNDKYWKLGQFYFNKNDPSLFLEKRFGVGWTINLARPQAWIILLTILILAAGIPILLGA